MIVIASIQEDVIASKNDVMIVITKFVGVWKVTSLYVQIKLAMVVELLWDIEGREDMSTCLILD